VRDSARGLAPDGTIAREGALDRVPPAFVPVVDAARTRISETFASSRLHSAYLYGSIARGTAAAGASDLDLMLALRTKATAADHADAAKIEADLDGSFSQIDGVGIGLVSTAVLLSELERYDLGFFVVCLCTPLLGDDLAAQLPRYRATSLLARETNGDLALVIPRWRAEAATDANRTALSRGVGRRLTRTGFTLVMPRWGGWTSDLAESADIFGHYYPERVDQMRIAAATGRIPTVDPNVLEMLVEDLAPWLAEEYTAVHGVKATR
jgi:predicted nucleotidyltransferase